MKTVKLYYENTYQKEFMASVLSCQKGKDGYEIILDQTAFYPEGGGQPSDRGVLVSQEGLSILTVNDVQEAGEAIVHKTDAPIEVGSKVIGKIDWARRFDLMQQHSGEHIVSGFVHEKYKYDNVGFHMGEEMITIDFSGMLTWEQLMEIEKKTNQYIWTNTQVKCRFIDGEDPTIPYRSKKPIKGKVRLVEYPGADLCACCGTHVDYTGEIGLVKIISVKKFHKGVRVEMLAGDRAMKYLAGQMDQNHQISVSLSAKVGETANAVERLKQENFDLRGEIMGLHQKEYERMAAECKALGDVLVIREDLEPAELRKCADSIMKACGKIAAVFSGNDRDGDRYALGCAGGNVRDLVKEMNGALNGRGGGKPEFAQGSLKADKASIQKFFSEKGFTEK